MKIDEKNEENFSLKYLHESVKIFKTEVQLAEQRKTKKN
jgi:hypothetical protein